jgi:hypothetical protein
VQFEFFRTEVDSHGKPFELIVRTDTLDSDRLQHELKANGWPAGQMRERTEGGTVVMQRRDYWIACDDARG